MFELSAEAQQHFQLLQANFTQTLPQKLSRINELWAEFKQNHSTDSFEELCRMVHSLAGSAGVFGYKELGRGARQLELDLRESFKQIYTENNELFEQFNHKIAQFTSMISKQ